MKRPLFHTVPQICCCLYVCLYIGLSVGVSVGLSVVLSVISLSVCLFVCPLGVVKRFIFTFSFMRQFGFCLAPTTSSISRLVSVCVRL